MTLFTLPKLPYAYNSLEPYIDSKTMEIHHGKHHQAYIDKLNTALAKHPQLLGKKVEDLLRRLDDVPGDIKTAVMNHGGGHLNHTLFWNWMTPNSKDKEFKGKIAETIKKDFGSFDEFKAKFFDAATSRFGSGWAWLVLNGKKLEIYNTSNQDSPLMESKIPLLGLDVWEHAYYLHYQNKRADYIAAWWNVVNWTRVNELYEMAKK